MAGDYMLGAHEATRRSLLPGHRRPAHARPAAGLAVGVQSLALGGRSEVGARASRLDEQKEFSHSRVARIEHARPGGCEMRCLKRGPRLSRFDVADSASAAERPFFAVISCRALLDTRRTSGSGSGNRAEARLE